MAYVDSLRLIAAMLVLLQHLFELREGAVRTYLIPLAPGVAGVAIFFFISGYVIPMAVRDGFDARSFMIRRVFRIYPLYLVALALIALAGTSGLLPKLGFVAEAPLRVWLANILLITDYVHVRSFLDVSWTLAVELVWYALFAAVILLFGRRAADRLDVIMPAALVGLALVSLVADTRVPLGRPLMIYAAVLGFQCFRHGAEEIDTPRLARSICVFVAVALFCNYVAFGVFAHHNLTLAQSIGPWIAATALFLIWVLYRRLREARVLNVGVLPLLGAMSYSIYLLHPLGTALADRYVPDALQIPVAIALTFALSWVGYRFVERPGITLGRKAVQRLVIRQTIARAT